MEHVAVVRREAGGVEAPCDAGGHAAELVLEAAELLGELGAGVGRGHGLGEAVVEDVEVPREDEPLRAAAEEALQEAELVGLGPNPLELERRRRLLRLLLGGGVGGGRVGGGGGGGARRRGAALDGELAGGGGGGGGCGGVVRVREEGCGRVRRVGRGGGQLDRDRDGEGLVRGHGDLARARTDRASDAGETRPRGGWVAARRGRTGRGGREGGRWWDGDGTAGLAWLDLARHGWLDQIRGIGWLGRNSWALALVCVRGGGGGGDWEADAWTGLTHPTGQRQRQRHRSAPTRWDVWAFCGYTVVVVPCGWRLGGFLVAANRVSVAKEGLHIG